MSAGLSDMRTRPATGAIVLAGCLIAADCGGQAHATRSLPARSSTTPTTQSGAAPTVVCGTVLHRGAAGAVIYEVTRADFNRRGVVTAPTVGGNVLVRVAADCRHGSHVVITPTDAFTTIRTVQAGDGLPVAVVLKPVRSVRATLVARQGARLVGTLKLHIAKANLAHH